MVSFQISLAMISVAMHLDEFGKTLQVSAVVLAIITLYFAIRMIRGSQGFDSKLDMKTILKALAAIIMLLIASSLLLQYLGIEPKEQPNQEGVNDLLFSYPIAVMFLIAFVAPIIEELVFRELLPKVILFKNYTYVSYYIVTILFILMHTPAGINGTISYTIMSFGFLYARLKHNNILTAIAVHMIWNTFVVIITLFL